MKNLFLFLLPFALVILGLSKASGQNDVVSPTYLSSGTFLGITPALKDIPPLTADELKVHEEKAMKKLLNKRLKTRSFPFASTALPNGPDEVWQQEMGKTSGKAPLVNFDAQTSPYYPPDCNGTAGPSHYMQTVNSTYAIYNKTGTLLAGPTNLNTMFTGLPGATYNDGDPIVLYDEMADRWFMAEFSISGSNDYMLVAVSTTNDPTGTWYKYSFDVAETPDYEKFGVWPDGYYMGTNNDSGNDIYVFERSVMLAGGASPKMVGFDNAWRPTTIDGFMCVPPVDNDGTAAPAGSPGLFITINDDAIGGGSDQLWIYELAVNWTTTSSSTFSRVQQINVTAFDSNFGADWTNIAQPGTTQQLDAIPQVIMNVPQYRNFGTYQTLVCCHTVDVDNTDHAGIRWYELRKTASTWSIRQQGTYAPDAHSRWMGSVMLNGSGKLGLGYSISSSSVYPGIRYTGQSAAAYAAATGTMDVAESVIQTGAQSQTAAERWGDYSLMSVDPSDDATFWFTTQYIASSQRKTKVASFKIGNAPLATTTAATSVTATAATLNGTVNPNGLATTYYFQWGTTTSYGTNTTSASAGSGTSTLSFSEPITGLITGTTYHFRIVATNADGTTYGSDMSFSPGMAVVTTTAAASITTNSAISGGNVLSDGGSVVTARGVCWATTANPTIAGLHTTDGSGTGSFTSSLTGLNANTTYHVRAYATNAGGTVYGDDLTFTTLCGIYTLPFSETFDNTTIPTCWSQIDNQGNGQIWQFGTITGQSPNPALSGNYAYLNSDAYGSGNSQNVDLVSPAIDLSSFSNVTLQFSHYFKSYSGSSGTLSYSITNGSSWTTIATFTTTSATNPSSFNQVIAAVAGQANVKFKWNYTGTYGYYWGIDDISVTGTSTSTPVVSTTAASSITSSTATSGGNVTSAGSSAVTARGVCWSTVANPTISDSHTTEGSGTGSFTSSLTGLTANTLYHVRAYATNSAGTAYGSDLQFTSSSNTLGVSPSAQTVPSFAGAVVYNVTSNTNWTASSNGAWCTVTPSGSGDGILTATYGENTGSARALTITVSAAGATPVEVQLNQLVGEPSNFPADLSAQNIILNWSDATGAILPTGYLIRMSIVGFSDIITPIDGVEIPNSLTDKNVAYGIQSAAFTNLIPNTTYYFKLFAYTGNGSLIDYKTDGDIPEIQVTTAP